MRKRLGHFLPIVMLAILVQLFVPIAVVRASAAAIADPLTGAMICESMTVSQSGDHDSSGPHKLGICCPLCTLAHAVTPFGHPPTTYIAIQRAYQLGHLPSQQEVLQIAEPWRPYRSLATAYLFQVALDDPGTPLPEKQQQ